MSEPELSAPLAASPKPVEYHRVVEQKRRSAGIKLNPRPSFVSPVSQTLRATNDQRGRRS